MGLNRLMDPVSRYWIAKVRWSTGQAAPVRSRRYEVVRRGWNSAPGYGLRSLAAATW